MKRILHCTGNMRLGGLESRIMDIYRAIDRSKVQFDFILTAPGEHHYFNEIYSLGGRVFQVDHPRIVGFSGYIKQFKNILTENGPFYALHAHADTLNGLALLAAKSVGIEHRIAHSRSASNRYANMLIAKPYILFMRSLMLKNATDLVTCGTEAGYFMFGRKAMNEGIVRFIPNAIDISAFARTIDKNSIREELNIPRDSIVIGNVGNLYEVKNHVFLLKVFKEFLNINPNSFLIIVGEGELRSQLEDQASKSKTIDRVKFLGRRTDIPEILVTFDVFVLPSLYEGVPGSVVEAQAAGLPCLLSDTVTRDIDVGTGLVSYLSLNQSINDWAEKINMLITAEKKDIGFYQDILIKKGYDVKTNVDKIMNIYNIK